MAHPTTEVLDDGDLDEVAREAIEIAEANEHREYHTLRVAATKAAMRNSVTSHQRSVYNRAEKIRNE